MLKNRFKKFLQLFKMQKGKMFILVDDKNRENEGDLIIPVLNNLKVLILWLNTVED